MVVLQKENLHYTSEKIYPQSSSCVAASCIKHICDCSCSFKSNRVWRQTLKFKMPLCDLVCCNVYSDGVGVISAVSGYLNPVFKLSFVQKNPWILNPSSWLLSLFSSTPLTPMFCSPCCALFIYLFIFFLNLCLFMGAVYLLFCLFKKLVFI